MNCDLFALKFRSIKVIVSQSKLDKCEKEILLLDTYIYEELITALKKTLAVVCTILKYLTFFLI